jgi:hypothetical protein
MKIYSAFVEADDEKFFQLSKIPRKLKISFFFPLRQRLIFLAQSNKLLCIVCAQTLMPSGNIERHEILFTMSFVSITFHDIKATQSNGRNNCKRHGR